MLKGVLASIPRWDTLRAFGENKTIKSAYIWIAIVPMLARLLERVDDVVTVRVLGHDISLLLRLPFSWEMFFFSALCFAAASMLYTIFCPPVVKTYSNFPAYFNAGMRGQQLFGYLYKVIGNPRRARSQWPKPEDLPWVVDFLSTFGDDATKTAAKQLMPSENPSIPDNPYTKYAIRDDALQDAFWAVWYKASAARPFVRLFITSLFGAGGVFLLIVLAQNVACVVRNL